MKSLLFCFAMLLFSCRSTCQVAVPTTSRIYFAKEFSKETSLYRAKTFLIEDVLDSSGKVVKFLIDALAATKSGELTSLAYQCEEQNKEGLILGLYGNRWNNAGVSYQAYAFKNFPKPKAIEILNKLEALIKEHSKFLDADNDNNNIYFYYDDMTFLIYRDGNTKIRVFWEDFDSEWEMVAFKRTKRRLLKILD